MFCAAEIGQSARRIKSRTRANVEDRLRHALRRGPDGRWSYKFDPNVGGGGLETDFERLWEEVRRIRCSTLLVRGAESAILTDEGAARFVRELPGAELADDPCHDHSALRLACPRAKQRVNAKAERENKSGIVREQCQIEA